MDFEAYAEGRKIPPRTGSTLNLAEKPYGFTTLKAMFALFRIFISIRSDIVHSIMPQVGLLAVLASSLCRVSIKWVCPQSFTAGFPSRAVHYVSGPSASGFVIRLILVGRRYRTLPPGMQTT